MSRGYPIALYALSNVGSNRGDIVQAERTARRGNKAGLLARLHGDTSANTLALMAMFLVPLSAMAGSAVDVARLYVVKSRIQQACDAGVLAGRKFMTDFASPTLDATATTRANTFFANNFKSGYMKTNTVSFTPTKTTDNQVNGVASVVVPMSVMKMFAAPDVTINVTCKARFDVADTDILFVLDTTGSMACAANSNENDCNNYSGAVVTYQRPSTSGGVAGYTDTTAYSTTEATGSRIEALRQAVLGFYDTFEANADPSTKVRYGFVTYSSSVNAGKAILDISPSYMVGGSGSETANYQSRRVIGDYVISNTSVALNGKGKKDCDDFIPVRTPLTPLTYEPSTGTATRVSNYLDDKKCYTQVQTLGPQWEYKQLPFEVSQLVNGSTVINPTKVRGQTMSWLGCVETPVEVPGASSFTVSSLPPELNPDLVPTGANKWFPHLQDLIYIRNRSYTNKNTDTSFGDTSARERDADTLLDEVDNHQGTDLNDKYEIKNAGYGEDVFADGSNAFLRNGTNSCGKPVKRLGVMTRTDLQNFVYATDFKPMGGTYHDIGMIWGSRLISPSGPWSADTAAWPGRNAPNRVLIFLTDGQMRPNVSIYGMYGVEGRDRRVANGDHDTDDLTDYHNKRFVAACGAAKARNVDVWTVAIGLAATAELQSCASTQSQALATTDGGGLAVHFQNIAKKLAMLRITQ